MTRKDEILAELADLLVNEAREHVGDVSSDDEEFECAREIAIGAVKSGDGLIEDVIEALKKLKPPAVGEDLIKGDE